MKRSVKISLTVIIWGLLYFLLLWRLPYCYQVNRIKLPDGCRTITVKARWSDMYVSHIAMGKMFKADKINTDALWDEILEENQELWKEIQKLPKHMDRLYIRGLGEPSWEFWPDYDIPADWFLGRVRGEDYEHYYVLMYNVDFDTSDAVIILCGGIISTVLAGITAGFLTRRSLRKKK